MKLLAALLIFTATLQTLRPLIADEIVNLPSEAEKLAKRLKDQNPILAPCYLKNRLAYDRGAVAIDAERLLVSLGFLSTQTLQKDWNLTTYDRLSGLAIVKSLAPHGKTPIKTRPADRAAEHENLLYMNDAEAAPIPTAKFTRQFGSEPAATSRQMRSGSLLVAPCYAVIGVSATGETIESEFLQKFFDSNESAFFWGDLGARFDGYEVEFLNPFAENELKVGDKIISINGKTFDSPREMEREIMLMDIGSDVNITIERKSAEKRIVKLDSNDSSNSAPIASEKTLVISRKIIKKTGGFLYADTFLEHLGWFFDRDLYARGVYKPKYPIDANDKIVAINGFFVNDDRDVKRVLTALADKAGKLGSDPGKAPKIKLLMQRESFQFFITIDLIMEQ
ncbi:MAG: PDZ domain-containing protein [Helicobacteraceae bacterium]|jgi:hypothetical protein|nr:PDZ domain-containing protein [Helicobacteraceae bacterium]